MPKPLPEYATDFPAKAEAEVAGCIEEAAEIFYASMQGGALDAALDAMQMIVTRFRAGDRSTTSADVMRAAREIRALMHEKHALLRMCRAQAIEKLGLRPRPPVDGTEAKPAPAKAAEKIVKTPPPVAEETPAAAPSNAARETEPANSGPDPAQAA